MVTLSATDQRPPEVGNVIEFSFLWKHEQNRSLIEGVKARQWVIIRILEGLRIFVVLITSSEPEHDDKIPLSPGAPGSQGEAGS